MRLNFPDRAGGTAMGGPTREPAGQAKPLPPAGDAHASDDPQITAVRDLVVTLVKTIQAFRMYPPSNPMPQGFFEILWEQLTAYLGHTANLRLIVEEHGLSFRDTSVYAGRDVKSNVAFLLFRDGIREITFAHGISRGDLTKLIQVFVRGEEVNRLEDDYVTLFWEADFKHIRYTAVDQFLENAHTFNAEHIFHERARAAIEAQPTTADHDELPGALEEMTHLLQPAVDAGVAASGAAAATAGTPPTGGGRSAAPGAATDSAEATEATPLVAASATATTAAPEEERTLVLSKRTVFELTDQEKRRLQREVAEEVAPDYETRIVDVQLALLTYPEAERAWKEIIATLSTVLTQLIHRDEYFRAADLLRGVRQLCDGEQLAEWKQESLAGLLTMASDGSRMEHLCAFILAAEKNLTDTMTFIEQLEPNSVPPLVALLGEIKSADSRRMLCNLLIHIGAPAVERFYPFLNSPRWFLVRNVVSILGHIGNPDSVPFLEAAFEVDNAQVKTEVLLALGSINAHRSTALLTRALADRDSSVRATAAAVMPKAGDAGGLAVLLDAVTARGFRNRDASETDAFFFGVGAMKDDAALPVLHRYLDARGWWFAHRKDDALRLGAANALAVLGSPAARAILETGAESPREAVRAACIRALREATEGGEL
jgi:HEAT repeat protein